MYEFFNQVNLPDNSRKDVNFRSCNIRNVFMVPRHYHISDENSETWILPKRNTLKQ